MLAAARAWWQARAPRERTILALGALALGVAAFWAYVWVPIEAERNRLIATLPQLRAHAQQVARDAIEVERLRNAARGRASSAPAARAIEDALRAAGLGAGFTGTSALGEGRVQANLGVVAFDPLVGALAQLAQVHGLAVETLVVRAAGEPGRVRVESLILKGPRAG